MEFHAKGEITVLGHRLEEGDLRLMYKFEGTQGSAQYDAESDQQVGTGTQSIFPNWQ